MKQGQEATIKVYHQGPAIYVVGTRDVQRACEEIGISPHTHQWGSTHYGYAVRRQGYWRYHSGIPQLPKDAKECVSFHGQIKESK